MLKAQTSGGITAGESDFTFIISPPFYRSRTAYLLYLALIIVGFFFFRRYMVRRLEAEKQKVETRKQLEMEYRKKKFDEEQLLAKQRITALENEKLHQDLTFKSKELSNSMINLLHMNENLGKIKSDLQRLYAEQDVRKREGIYRQLNRFINSQISTPKYMELFDLNFSAVHEDFINNLKERYPQLSQNDIKLCAFLKMNKSTKEIASLLNISTRGVETSRHRLRKKMGLSRDENLYTYISSI
jgi:DNA-binding CsgD family transcriptional regulator/cell division protein FtsL